MINNRRLESGLDKLWRLDLDGALALNWVWEDLEHSSYHELRNIYHIYNGSTHLEQSQLIYHHIYLSVHSAFVFSAKAFMPTF